MAVDRSPHLGDLPVSSSSDSNVSCVSLDTTNSELPARNVSINGIGGNIVDVDSNYDESTCNVDEAEFDLWVSSWKRVVRMRGRHHYIPGGAVR